jgi:uncharacterized protein YjbI with pentapeptide repeats
MRFMGTDVIKCLLILFFSCIFYSAQAQDDPLMRRITLTTGQTPLKDLLHQVSIAGKFYFSYNSSGIDESRMAQIDVQRKTVKHSLELILGKQYEFKSGGNHVIILPKAGKNSSKSNQTYRITGVVKDAQTGKTISSVSIIELGERNITSSDQSGTYQLPLKGNAEFVKILVSRKNYRDTVFTIKPELNTQISIPLMPLPQIEKLNSLSATVPVEMEENGLFRSVVSEEQQILSYNLPLYEQRNFQASFVPNLGTNRSFSGLVENHISFNAIGGYSMALSGFELAGLFNITRRNVRGAQIGGFMNITGGQLSGFQLAGFMNNNIGAIHGVQTAGFYNLSLDSLNGVQMAGFFNMARNRVRGVQTAGFLNISGKELRGVQMAGFVNLSGKDAKGAQLSGFCNIATGNMDGVQAAGMFNLSTGNLRGAQLSGGINVTLDTTNTVQVGTLANFARIIYGTQISLLNIAGEVGGSQIGLINYCDTVNGLPLGLISIVRKGVHQLEFGSSDASDLLVTLKSGTHRLYNVLSAGMFNLNNSSLASFGYGIGSMGKHKTKLGGGGEFVLSLVFNEAFASGIFPDTWGRVHPFISYKPFKWLQLTAGPSVHIYWIDNSNISGLRPDDKLGKDFQFSNQTGNGTAWLGWQFGIRLF